MFALPVPPEAAVSFSLTVVFTPVTWVLDFRVIRCTDLKPRSNTYFP